MSWLSDLLQGIPLNSVLKERMALAEQKVKDAEEEKKKLESKVAALVLENDDLKKQLAVYTATAGAKPTVKWGCYQFEGDNNLYCPGCYDTKGKKYLCTRTVAKTYKCSVCQTDHGF